jgi:hypothetical protein
MQLIGCMSVNCIQNTRLNECPALRGLCYVFFANPSFAFFAVQFFFLAREDSGLKKS